MRGQRADQLDTMNSRADHIKKLVDEGSYPMDEAAIADAIIARSLVRSLVPDIAFRPPAAKPAVRSFRHHSGARSFRLHRTERRPADVHAVPFGSLARAA